ncbi:MAG: OmpH family outer membrane protein [Aureispira sp.]|nr:OmpH family outer membrane protein [Aureispira sp.]
MKIHLLLIGLWLNMGLCYAQNQKIGVVDMDMLLEALPEKDSLTAMVRQFAKTCEKGLRQKEQLIGMYYQKVMQEAQSSCHRTPDYYKTQEKKLQTMQSELQALALTADSTLQVVETTFIDYMDLQIELVCQEVGKEQGYQFILKKKDCLFYNLNLSITELILQELKHRDKAVIGQQLETYQKQLDLSIRNLFNY